MERRETHDILQALGRTTAEGRRAALATVVRVRGSAYRREGARMLIADDGALTCMLSGGCLEPEVAEVAARVLATGRAELRHYDLAEDVVWGLGLGCGGTVDVLIEPAVSAGLLGEWLSILRQGASAVLATPLSGGVAERVLVAADGSLRGTTGQPSLDAWIANVAAAMLGSAAPRSEACTFEGARGTSPDEAATSGPQEVFFDVSAPPPELVVFGAGHDAIPVVEQALRLGWAVVVVDSRAVFTSADRFPGARLVVAPPSDLGSRLVLTPRSHALVMNHHLERDAASLAFALASEASWIGVLGPRSRYEKLLASLRDTGLTIEERRPERVRNPVGLDIGAESAGEVALAIVAALVAERRGFKGGLLDKIAGRIHDPDR